MKMLLLLILALTNLAATTRPVSTRPTTMRAVELSDAELASLPDSSATLQAIIDALPVGASLKLEPGKHYRLTKYLRISKTMELDGQGAWLLLDHRGAWPNNYGIIVGPPPSGDIPLWLGKPVEWEATLKRGDTNLGVSSPWSHAYVHLGTDPHDPAEEHYGFIVERGVVPPLPLDIAGRKHKLYPLAGTPDGTVIRDINFRTLSGQTDINIWVYLSRRCEVHNIGGQLSVPLGIGPVADGFRASGITGHVAAEHGAGGRVLVAGQTRGIWVSDVDVTYDLLTTAAFFENWADGVSLERWKLRGKVARNPLTYFDGSNLPVFEAKGGSKNIVINDVEIDGLSPVYLFDTGGWSPGWDNEHRPHFRGIRSRSPVLGGKSGLLKRGIAIEAPDGPWDAK
jgi:hypothetical protein